MEHFRERILNLLRIMAWYFDYAIYLIFNPFKFKPLPKIVKNILLLESKYIGDIIVLTASIHAIKNKYPGAKIDIVIPPVMADLLKNNQDISNIISFDGKAFSEKLAIVKGKYDLAVIFHNGTFNMSLLLLMAKVKFRIGCTKVGIAESKGYFMHRNTKPTSELKHKLDDNLDVIKKLGISSAEKKLFLYTDKASDKKIGSLFAKKGISKKAFVVLIHPKPQHESHEWFKEKFASLADKLSLELKAKIIFSGSEKDIAYNNEIIHIMKCKAFNLAGTSLADFMSLVKASSLVISVDTGAMHVAAALDKPVIALFGAGNPKIWKPYCNKSFVVFNEQKVHTSCMKHHCYLKDSHYMECMNSISIDDVFNIAREAKNDSK